MRPAHPVRHGLFRRANQLSVVPAVHRRAAGAAIPPRAAAPRAAGPTASAAGPFDKAKHHGSGDGTAICRRARRAAAAQAQIEGAENCFGHHRVPGCPGRTRRGRLVWHSEIQGTQGGRGGKEGKSRGASGRAHLQRTIQALGILTKVHSAYTNFTSVKEDGTVTLSLDLSNLTFADLNPDAPVNTKNPNRRPQGMPRIITNTTEYSVKRAQSNWFYFAGEAASKIDRHDPDQHLRHVGSRQRHIHVHGYPSRRGVSDISAACRCRGGEQPVAASDGASQEHCSSFLAIRPN